MAKADTPATGTATVTVALKHPTGVVIEAYEKSEEYEPVLGGGQRKIDVYHPTGVKFTINGNRVPFGEAPNFEMASGFALTPGVPKDLWENWRRINSDSALVRNGLIFAHESTASAKAEAKNNAKTVSGLEPLAQKNDPRSPKRLNREGKFVEAVERADEQPSPA